MTASDPRVGEIEARLAKLTGRTAINGSFGDVLRIVWTTYYFGADLQWHNARTGLIEQAETLLEEIEASEGDWGWLVPSADVAYLLAELRKATRAAQTLGQVIEKQCRDVLDVTGLHHLINEDGDGHWDVVWMRLFEMRDELASLKDSTIGRERLRGDSWRDRAQEMEVSRDATAAELADRDEKLAKVEALATEWDERWGRYSHAAAALGPQSIRIESAVKAIRAAVAAAGGSDNAHD